MTYSVEISETAMDDLCELSYTITETYSLPLTAIRYLDGIFEKIEKISQNPAAFPIRFNLSLLQYGADVRRANYKKMAIIYTVDGSVVLIHRVIAASLIID
ncbi:hypothetical protein AGMMS49982_19270 [Bacteroidia bacterium]|nr:hypothetical protein AGMMS49982_19270 [Bacteroidia bacterium]